MYHHNMATHFGYKTSAGKAYVLKYLVAEHTIITNGAGFGLTVHRQNPANSKIVHFEFDLHIVWADSRAS